MIRVIHTLEERKANALHDYLKSFTTADGGSPAVELTVEQVKPYRNAPDKWKHYRDYTQMYYNVDASLSLAQYAEGWIEGYETALEHARWGE